MSDLAGGNPPLNRDSSQALKPSHRAIPGVVASNFPTWDAEKCADWRGADPVPPHLLPFHGQLPIRYVDDTDLYSWIWV